MVICMGAGDITKWAAALADGICDSEGAANERRRDHAAGARQADAERAARAARLVQERRQRRMAVRAGRRATTSSTFLRELDPDVPVMALGLGSNLIVRDGGVPGVVVRLGKPFAKIERLDETTLRCGGGASGILVSSTARDAGIAGPRIPARHSRHRRRLRAHERRRLRPRGQRHPRLGAARAALRRGRRMAAREARLHLSPQRRCPKARSWSKRRSAARPATRRRSAPRWTRIARAREESQPLRSRTGGSTFKNPPGHKAWALVDAAGCRGLTHGRRPSLGKALQFPAQPR